MGGTTSWMVERVSGIVGDAGEQAGWAEGCSTGGRMEAGGCEEITGPDLQGLELGGG